MAFRQHHRPQPSRQLSFHSPERPAEVGVTTSPQRKRPLEDSEEWVLFSPVAPSTTARTHTTSTERTPRTAGLSRLSDFGSLDTAARSQGDDDDITCQGTEEGELDSLDDGLHAFHEPSEYGVPVGRLQESGDALLPTHDGLGTFSPSAAMQEHMWQFERQTPRRRHARRRSSVQRRLDALDEAEDDIQEHDRRQRIEKWRLEQSKALLEEIERETRRRRRMSLVSAARSRVDSAQEQQTAQSIRTAASVSDGQSESSDESSEHLSFWQRLTRRVIRDLMGIDEDTLSVIFGEALPDEEGSADTSTSKPRTSGTSQTIDALALPGDPWEHRLLERIARELGILVNQLSEHPGAFSTYVRTQQAPEYAGLSSSIGPAVNNSPLASMNPSSFTTAQLAVLPPTVSLSTPSFQEPSYNESALWGIEEEPEVDPLSSFRAQQSAPPPATADVTREREYWEQELDVKMVFNFLVKRFSSRRSSNSSRPSGTQPVPASQSENDISSARRAAMIRQHHPLVNHNTDRLATSSSAARESRRKDLSNRHYNYTFNPQFALRNQVLRSSSSCASQSTKKSKRSGGSGRNYWDLGGSVGSGSVRGVEV